MIITTTDSVPGRTVREIAGIVTGTEVLPAGGSGKLADKLWKQAMTGALASIESDAAGADAIIGLRVELDKGLVRLYGTAVKF